MQEITLMQILQAREDRVCKQQTMLQTHGTSIICFTMNIAGPVKTSPLIERAFRQGLCFLQARIAPKHILAQQTEFPDTGPLALLAVDMPAAELKSICIQIENTPHIGRLFDIDVIDKDGNKLSRTDERGCFVCGAAGRACAARRLHSLAELSGAVQTRIVSYFQEADRKKVAALAVDALIREVETTPKPGLVDRRNNGSHTDMDIDLFIKSAQALAPYFYSCIKIGQETCHKAPQETFSLLRLAGIEAEKTMFKATDGINTHKGAIFSLGTICGAYGRLYRAEQTRADICAILAHCGVMTAEAMQSDFTNADSSTAGMRLYRQYNLTGIRGEAACGFASVSKIGLPAYSKALNDGHSENDAAVLALLALISGVKDTNLYHRGGQAGADFAASKAKALLKSGVPSMADVEALDDMFIAKNLSPGGCADLLAVTLFLHAL